jgi:hypothetical protein
VVARFGTTRPVVLGCVAGLAGFLLCVTGPWARTYPTGVLPVLLLVGVGLALAFGPLNAQAASTGPAGVARYQCAVQIGAAAAVLACTAAVAGHLHNRPQKTVEVEV